MCHLAGVQFPLKIVDALPPGCDVLLQLFHAVVMHRVAFSIAGELGGERARAWWAECVKPNSWSEFEEHAPQLMQAEQRGVGLVGQAYAPPNASSGDQRVPVAAIFLDTAG